MTRTTPERAGHQVQQTWRLGMEFRSRANIIRPKNSPFCNVLKKDALFVYSGTKFLLLFQFCCIYIDIGD